MLETDSIFNETIGLAANPEMINADVTVNFESFIIIPRTGERRKASSSVGFINYNGTLLGVGTVGE